MDETILLIKRLLFAYSSIFLVLTFAIIQSDHGRYDRALASIDEIHKLTAAIDGNFLSRLTAPNAAIRKVERRHLSAFKSNISFEYNSQHIDYALTPKPLMGDVNGFAFARSSVEEFPDEFLKYDRVSEFVPPLRKVSSLRDYMPLHDALLVDARYEALVPELTKPIRMELYRQSSRSFNVIDQVTVEHADSYKILDAIDLVSPVKGADEKTCRLTPIRTQINDQHGFVCHVSGVVSDGQQYSARLFVQAESTIELLTHDAMLEIIKIPTSRQVDFDVAHRELAQLAGPYPGLAFEDLYKVLETEKKQNTDNSQYFGCAGEYRLIASSRFRRRCWVFSLCIAASKRASKKNEKFGRSCPFYMERPLSGRRELAPDAVAAICFTRRLIGDCVIEIPKYSIEFDCCFVLSTDDFRNSCFSSDPDYSSLIARSAFR